jgi:hypothetical protein
MSHSWRSTIRTTPAFHHPYRAVKTFDPPVAILNRFRIPPLSATVVGERSWLRLSTARCITVMPRAVGGTKITRRMSLRGAKPEPRVNTPSCCPGRSSKHGCTLSWEAWMVVLVQPGISPGDRWRGLRKREGRMMAPGAQSYIHNLPPLTGRV